MINLSDVTLCAADCLTGDLAARALRICMTTCQFGDAILFSSQSIRGPFRTVSIPTLTSRAAYSAFMLRDLPRLIETPFALICQWDGYIVESSAWLEAFRNYDYIGARWQGLSDRFTVGNGGFSLRSRRLLQALQAPQFTKMESSQNEDVLISRVFRRSLERDFGIRFAPDDIADAFSYERILPLAPTFGFHGFFNFWRHVDDATMMSIVAELPRSCCSSNEFIETVIQYLAMRKFPVFAALYSRLRSVMDATEIESRVNALSEAEHIGVTCVSLGERLNLR